MKSVLAVAILLLTFNLGASAQQEEAWIIRTDQSCALSPDETVAAVANEGVYDLAAGGALLFPFPEIDPAVGQALYFNAAGTHVALLPDGVYEIASGTKVVTFTSDQTEFRRAGDYMVVVETVDETVRETLYDTRTWDIAFPPFEFTASQGANHPDRPDERPGRPGLYLYGDTVVTYDALNAALMVYDFTTQEKLYTREVYGTFHVDPSNSYIAVSGEDIRSLRDNTPVMGSIPVVKRGLSGYTYFSTDGHHVLIEYPAENSVQIFDIRSGEHIGTLPRDKTAKAVGLFITEFRVSDDNRTVTFIRNEGRLEPHPKLSFEIDLATGDIIDSIGFWAVAANAVISPDGRYYATAEGIYQLDSGDRIVAFDPAHSSYLPVFATAAPIAIQQGEGVYDLISGRKLYDLLPYSSSTISPDGRFVWARDIGLLDGTTGAVLFPMTDEYRYGFSPHSRYMTVMLPERCEIFALPQR